MKRIGIYFMLKAGAKNAYKEAHRMIWPEMRQVLDVAGIKNYSIWNLGEQLFAYYEVDDEEKMKTVLSESKVYKRWRDWMEEFVYQDENGTKEWPMEMVFYNKGN